MPIRRLPTLLVNQIAAGEVIERPASVVKECVENAIDAGATRIDVAIEVGGKELIRIADNGGGIPFDELPLAVAPHATSKIESQDDLDAIATMGFRGEALASIASVSRMSILSRTREQDGAGLLEIEGDDVREARPASGPVGTTVTVRNLFFNTPARRKFLRADQTETGRVSEVVHNLALAHPSIGFTLRIDNRQTLDLPPDQSPRRRALEILGTELESQLIEFNVEERGIGLWGLAGTPDIARGTAKHQRVFLNGRMINDRSIAHAMKEAYRGLIEPGRFPTIVLFMRIDPAQVDVNVHPAKAEVRFRNQTQVHGAVLTAVRNALKEADLTPRFDMARSWTGGHDLPPLALPASPRPEFSSGMQGVSAGGAPEFVEYFRSLNPAQKGFVYSEVKQALAEEAPEILAREGGEVLPGNRFADDVSDRLPNVEAKPVSHVLQVHSSYIVTQDDQGIVIIDQHALHERVMFEKLKARIGQTNLESQRLLMPATVEADRSQVDSLEELKPLLERIGIEAEPIGPTAVAIHAFTSLLFERNVDPITFMSELLDRAANDGLNDNPEAALHEVLDMMACKAAVKAGDSLTADELADLLRYRETIERSSNCPHGRPTSLRLSLRELEKQFGRS
ncbi:MAG TPA: DNA mismatch repair endonuclease MutL [Phycisphaerales bacterium]|nr:DNA mismatch repair endonuclease MutL [Phycisphaerales bacterium]HRQ75602.1 DNA mismatch repair endonuclease MutL [Phycisphaerales bacterium]